MSQMLTDRLFANPQDPSGLPVRFPSRRPHHALALPIGQKDRTVGEPISPHSARGFEGERANELKKRKLPLLERIVRCARERARAMRFTRYMCRNRVTLADTFAS